MERNLILAPKDKREFIPVGMNCEVSHFLREQKLRVHALPFDWNITPIQSVVALLENNFDDFLNPKNLIFLPPTKRLLFTENEQALDIQNDIVTPVFCRKYNILFPHDFSAAGEGDLQEVRQKYQRRIARLKSLLQDESKTRVFVYCDGPLNEWQCEQYRACGAVFQNNIEGGWRIKLNEVVLRHHPQAKSVVMSLAELKDHLNPKRQVGFWERMKGILRAILLNG